MIAQLKVLANAKEIEGAQKEYQNIAQQNAMIDAKNKELAKAKREPLIPLPIVPEPQYKSSDLLIKETEVSLAFVNSTGEISIKYQGDNFNLVYSDEVWNQLKNQFN